MPNKFDRVQVWRFGRHKPPVDVVSFNEGFGFKGLSAFTGEFPSSTAGLHLVLHFFFSEKKSCLVRYRMVECFHAITIDAKHLYFYRCEPYCIIFPSRIKSFPRNPFEFLHIRESLASRDSRLDPRDSILETRSSNVSSIEARGSSLKVRV